MISKVLSIKIGETMTRVCLMDYRSKNPRIYQSFSMQTPENVISDGVLQGDIKNFASSLRNMIIDKNMRTKYVVFSVQSTKIATREVKLPFVKANRIGAMVAANSADYFPIDLANYQISHNILGTEEDEQGKRYKIQVLAAPRTLFDGYTQLAELCDLEIVAVDYAGNSVYQVAKAECGAGANLVMKVGEKTSLMMVIENDSVLLSRTIPYGVDDAITEIQNNRAFGPKLSYEQAITLARRKTCIRLSLQDQFSDMEDEEEEYVEDNKDVSKELLEAKTVVTESFEPLISQTIRMLDFYNSRYPKTPIVKIHLTGAGAEFAGLSKLMTNSIGSKVTVLSKISGLHIDKFFRDSTFGEYIENIGAAMAPINLYEIKKKKSTTVAGVDKNVIPVIVFAVSMAVSVVLIVSSVLPYEIAKRTNEHDKVIIEQLRSIEPIYNEYNQVKGENEYLTSMEEYTWTHNKDLVEFIEEMEKKMPSATKITAFTSNRDGFTIGFTVNNKKEAAKIVSQFRTFNSVADVEVTALADTKAESGVREVTFTLQGTYKEKEQMEYDAIEDDAEATDTSAASQQENNTNTSEPTQAADNTAEQEQADNAAEQEQADTADNAAEQEQADANGNAADTENQNTDNDNNAGNEE
ncbi:MAG: pilus assembly protein PilM [Lachnospiraceae bacterium]|nr:pilus assembly protein PilM [Lachnospiraceae bacterium]